MAQALEILIITGFSLIVCFLVGKKWGERKYLKIKEELKAHELAFNQLLERMDMVSSHNLKVLESKTEELRQLVPVVDKKLLFAGDLLQEFDALQKPSFLPPALPPRETPTDLKFRREIQEIFQEMKLRVQDLESRLDSLENAERKRLINDIARPSALTVKVAQDFATDRSIMVSDKVFEKPGQDRALPLPVSAKALRNVETAPRLIPHEHLNGTSVRELRPPNPAPGSVLADVLRLHRKGVALAQIARELKMGHGEVELIMKIYGGGDEPLRKVT